MSQFFGNKPLDPSLPPGQTRYVSFPVLHRGNVPVIHEWHVRIDGLVKEPKTFSMMDIMALPQTEITTNIHCVTRWSKFGTHWQGVSIDELFGMVGVLPEASHMLIHSYGDYTTHLALEDALLGKAMIATAFDHKPLSDEHGGPARLLVPHLYFYKSAKWIERIELLDHEEFGFWEQHGYHKRGDPWKEQRYSDD